MKIPEPINDHVHDESFSIFDTYVDEENYHPGMVGTISTFNAYDTLRRHRWAALTGFPVSESYKQWGDDDLRSDWLDYVRIRHAQGGLFTLSTLLCLVQCDRSWTAKHIQSTASDEQRLFENKRLRLPFPYVPAEGRWEDVIS